MLQELQQPRWARLRVGMGAALVNCTVPLPPSPESAYLTLGAGRRVKYRERLSPGRRDDEAKGIGALGTALSDAHRETLLWSASSASTPHAFRGMLTAADDRGTIGSVLPLPGETDARARLLAYTLPAGGLEVVDLPAGTSPGDALDLMARVVPQLDPQRDLAVLFTPDPGSPTDLGWSDLSLAVFWGGPWAHRGVGSAISTTTRTPGLIANHDLAPTLLHHLDVPIPPVMEGHAVQSSSVNLTQLSRMARHAQVNRTLMEPTLLGWGILAVLCAGWVFLAMARRTAGMTERMLLAATAGFLVALLLSAWTLVGSPAQLLARIVLWDTALVLVAWLWRRRLPPVLTILALLVGTLLVDLFLGGRMLAHCLLGDFWNTGVRFYGLGNEYEGLAVGTAAVVPYWIEHVRRKEPPSGNLSREGWWATATLWLLALVLCGASGFGADFGGVLSLAITYAVGVSLALRGRVKPLHLLGMGILVLVIAGVFVGIDVARPAGSRSHVGELAAHAVEQGPGLVFEIIFRKLAMNGRMALTPYFLGFMAVVAPLLAICYHKLGRGTGDLFRSRPLLRNAVLTAVAGGTAALLLNDSGVVAWAFAVGCALMVWLDLLLVTSTAHAPVRPGQKGSTAGAAPQGQSGGS